MKICNLTKLAGLAAAALLAGCASTPQATQTVYVPVATSCVKTEDIPVRPAFAVEQLSANATDGEKIVALARDWPVGRKYEGGLEAALAGCRQ